jgi:histone-lysine N-methyltransferase SETD2
MYFMALNYNEIVDASRKGNVARFINHSCSPNLSVEKW